MFTWNYLVTLKIFHHSCHRRHHYQHDTKWWRDHWAGEAGWVTEIWPGIVNSEGRGVRVYINIITLHRYRAVINVTMVLASLSDRNGHPRGDLIRFLWIFSNLHFHYIWYDVHWSQFNDEWRSIIICLQLLCKYLSLKC